MSDNKYIYIYIYIYTYNFQTNPKPKHPHNVKINYGKIKYGKITSNGKIVHFRGRSTRSDLGMRRFFVLPLFFPLTLSSFHSSFSLSSLRTLIQGQGFTSHKDFIFMKNLFPVIQYVFKQV